MVPRQLGQVSFVLLIIVALQLTGCGISADPRGKRVAVEGEVTLDGQPLNRAQIVFRALNQPNTVTATGQIIDGRYQITARNGPLAGWMRVEIIAETIDLAEFQQAVSEGELIDHVSMDAVEIPAAYNTHSTLAVEVSEDKNVNQFDFQLTTDPRSDGRTYRTESRYR